MMVTNDIIFSIIFCIIIIYFYKHLKKKKQRKFCKYINPKYSYISNKFRPK